MKPRDFLSYYATQFATVEVDSTFYRTPSVSTVTGWYEKTPPDFIFPAKVPQVITPEKVLVDCEPEFDEFIARMDLLDEKLGPLVLQFPFFNRYAFKSVGEFLSRLRFFLKRTQGMFTCKFAAEIRNKSWLDARFADLLREHNVALALTDQEWMPRPLELFEKFDPITADFSYVRWLGDRKGIEEQTRVWDKVIVDRTSELKGPGTAAHQAEGTLANRGADRGAKPALARVGRVLQTRPRSQTLPPTRWLDTATDLVASVQALEKRRLEATAQEDALPRARACQLSRANPFVGISDRVSLRESCIREMCTCSLSGGRRPARKRASSDPTPIKTSANSAPHKRLRTWGR
jgi:uncharacterized protein YecE (DUF72 family)